MTRRSPRMAVVLAVSGLVLSGCGSTEPAPLKRLDPVVPSDLCAFLPKDVTQGLETSATTTETGDPTAACSLRSKPGAKGDVRGLVTVLVLNDEDSADTTYRTQCAALDPAELRKTKVHLPSADESCAGKGKRADTATLAAVAGRKVITVRYSAEPAGKPDAVARATQLARSVLPQDSSS